MQERKILKSLILIIIVLFHVKLARSANEKFNSRIQASDIITNSTLIVQDDKYPAMQGFTLKDVTNKIIFSIDHASNVYYTQSFTATIDIEIKYYNENGILQPIENKTLELFYDPASGIINTDKSVYKFSGGHFVEVKILSINSSLGTVPDNLALEAEIDIERYYDFDQYNIPEIEHQLSTSGFDLDLSWDYIEGTEEYDLEWIFVNDYYGVVGTYESASTLEFDFENNATRVTVSATNYTIPLVFEHGYILYRVRGVGLWEPDFIYRKEGLWSSNGIDNGIISSFSFSGNPNYFHNSVSHEGDKFNWLYSLTFAENGKRTESIGYYDGFLRNRQSIIKNNSINRNIVQETIYDFNNRPAISILPVPAISLPLSGEDEYFHYYSDFNQNTTGSPYSALDFDPDNINSSLCPTTEPMSDISGASLYYSSQNPFKEAQQSYIPDASGFPFSRIEYTPDLTGRINRAGGVGPNFQLDQGHEVTYLYANPSQIKLNRLFGTESGYSNSYKKNSIIDQNGQISNFYIDASGKIVATSLAGQKPIAVDTIAGNYLNVDEIEELLGNNQINYNDETIILESYILSVSKAQTYAFIYELTPAKFEDLACMPGICFDCKYDLIISIKGNNCGENEMWESDPDEPFTVVVGQTSYDDVCQNDLNPPISANIDLEVGAYTVSKILKLNNEHLEDYTDSYITNNICLDQYYQDFLLPILNTTDFSGCEVDECLALCLDNLGYRDDWAELGYSSVSEYDAALAACIYDCEIGIDECSGIYKQMLRDVSPGGQYGLYLESDNVTVNPGLYPLSVYNVNNHLPDNNAAWNQVLYYLEDGTLDAAINFEIANNTSFTVSQFLAQWKPSWAESLVQFHPEYCAYEWCMLNDASHEYDNLMEQTTTFDEAISKGLLNPLNMSSPVSGITSYTPTTLIYPDPFFDTGYGSLYITDFTNELINFQYNLTFLSIWETAIAGAYCLDFAGNPSEINTCVSDYFTANTNFGDEPCKEDFLWNVFKELYLNAKRDWYYKIGNQYTIDNDCFNGCIGNADFYTSSAAYNFNCPSGTNDCLCDEPYPENQVNAFNDDLQPCWFVYGDFYVDKIPIFQGINGNVLDDTPPDLNAECQISCEELADGWMSNLSGCAGVVPGPGLYDDIRRDLIAVCANGCDIDYPFPTSTSPNTGYDIPGSSPIETAYSFDDVLEYYLGTSYPTETCTYLLISDPGPYNSFINESEMYIDDCGCDKILETDYQFNFENYPLSVTSVEELFEYNYGIEMLSLKNLICECNNAFPSWTSGATWPASSISYLTDLKELVPITINCEKCLTCTDTEYTNQKSLFESDYPNAIPGTSEYYLLFAVYINNALGYNFGSTQYEQFELNCSFLAGATNYCEPPTTEASDLLDLLNYFGANSLFYTDITTPVDLSLDNTYASSSLFDYTPYHHFWTETNEVSSGIIKLHIGHNTIPALEGIEIILEDPNYNSFDFSSNPTFTGLTVVQEDNGISYKFTVYIDGILFNGRSNAYPLQMCISDQICKYSQEITQPLFNNCVNELVDYAELQANQLYYEYIEEKREDFIYNFKHTCLDDAEASETFTAGFSSNEYHYTLYYYDQAGNLVQTIPPEGIVELDVDVENGGAVDVARNTTGAQYVPGHHYHLGTKYRYNSYNALIESESPDGGKSHFWYDIAGRLVVSQNAKQATADKYSYTIYDDIGRIFEVGEVMQSTTPMTNIIAEDITTWLSVGVQSQITRTFYDEPLNTNINSYFSNNLQENLRLRVATIAYYEIDAAYNDYTNASHFTYDELGNVKEIVQEITDLMPLNEHIKLLTYDYDLVSGNVNTVYYQKDEKDQFIHKYEYDDNNRLTNVYTSNDDIIWNQDAEYFYYWHGPLARVEIGDKKVQGLDFFFNLQGNLKGMNITDLDPSTDIGLDGNENITNINKFISRDEFAFGLGFFQNDYTPINTTASMGAITSVWSDLNPDALYNGNISYAVYDNAAFGVKSLTADKYKYDQLHRIINSRYYPHDGTNFQDIDNSFDTDYSYDANGNLLSLNRINNANVSMDQLSYHYTDIASDGIKDNNQLIHVSDPAGQVSGTDLDDQGTFNPADENTWNYNYDEIGNLIKDKSEEIENIEWTAYGKVKKVTRTTNSHSFPDIEFEYDATGRRILKLIKPRVNGVLQNQSQWVYTYYIRDFRGNIMTVYEKTFSYEPHTPGTDYTINELLMQKETPLYGSKRLGVKNNNKELLTRRFRVPESNEYLASGEFNIISGTEIMMQPGISELLTNEPGRKQYEITNHLGNVMLTINDKRTPVIDAGNIIAYNAERVSANDYYPFGMLKPGRGLFPEKYKFGFGGQEMDNEINSNIGASYTAEYWQYDSRLGRRWNVDPLAYKFPWQSPYVAFDNNPIRFVDPLGLEATDPPSGYKDNGKGTATKTNADGTTWTMTQGADGNWSGTGGDMGTLPEVTVGAEGPKTTQNKTGGGGFSVSVNEQSYRFTKKGDPLYIPYQSVDNYNYWNNNKDKFVKENGDVARFSEIFMSNSEWWGEVAVDIGIEWTGGDYKKEGDDMTTHPIAKYEKWKWNFPSINGKEMKLKITRDKEIRDMKLLQSVPVMHRSTEDDTYLRVLEKKYSK